MYYNPIENLKPSEIIDYFRKSRTDDPSLSVSEVLSKHESILDDFAERNLGAVVPEENKYREVVSGETIADRPEFQKVLKLIESPKIRAILVVEVQRLSRGDLEDAGRLIKLLRYTNTLVITPMKTFDLKDEYDRDMFERELKRGNEFLEYQKKIMGRGRMLSASQGNYIGTNPPYGYDKIIVMEGKRKCPTLAINEEQADIVRMIFHSYVHENVGTTNIANRLNALQIKPPKSKQWTADTIRDMLENPHYIGRVRWNARKAVLVVDDGQFRKTRPKTSKDEVIFSEGKHEALISEELFQAAQEKRGRSHRTCDNRTLRNPFASVLFCECGRAMCYRDSTHGRPKSRRDPRLVCNDQPRCGNGSCSVTELVDFVAGLLTKKIEEYKIEVKRGNTETEDFHENLIKNLEKKLIDLGAREISLWESQVDPDPAVRMPPHIFQTLTEKLTKERADTEQALAEARSAIKTRVNYDTLIVTLQNAVDALLDDEMSASEKNQLVKACVSKITYRRDIPQRVPGSNQRTSPPIYLDIKLKV